MPPVEVSVAAVRALLARWFPGQAVAVERVGVGVSTPVYRVMASGEVYYLRLGEEPGERRDAEIRVHELVRGLGIAAPEAVRWERDPPELDRSAVLTSRMPGIPLARFQGDPGSALRQAGRDLARINAIPVHGYGWVDRVGGDDRRLVAEHASRAAWAAEYVAAADTVIAADILPDRVCPALRDAIRAWAEWPDRIPARLVHGDFDVSHIYVDPVSGAYRGIIDFGEIRGADPLYDLGHALVHDPVSFDGIVAGYREVAPVDLAAVRLQAVAITTRALVIQLTREPTAYRTHLIERLGVLVDHQLPLT